MATLKVYTSKDTSIANHHIGGWYIYQAGAKTDIALGCWDWEAQPYASYYAYQARGLLQFTMPSLPVGAVVASAKLKMILNKSESMHSWNSGYTAYNQNPTIQVHRVLQPWDEGTGTGFTDGYQYTGATWSTRANGGYGWNAYGGYFDAIPSASNTEAWASHEWSFDVTSLVNYWLANPTQNFGCIVKYANDHIAQGELWSFSKECGSWAPYIEITYNTAPEKPRGLSPNFNSFVCNDLAHTTHFKWNFVDVAAPPTKGRTDVVFLIDTSTSMNWNLGNIRNEVGIYCDRMTNAGIDWQAALVAFSDIRSGEAIRKYGWFNNKAAVQTAYDQMPRYSGGDWPESGLDAISDPTNGALSFTFRNPSKVHFIICTDAPFHNKTGIDTGQPNYSIYDFNTVITDLKARGIAVSMNANTHCSAYTQLHGLPQQTGGRYYDEYSGWGNYMELLTAPYGDESLAVDEGDYQTKADLRIFKINGDKSRTLIWSYTVVQRIGELRVKELGVPWEEGQSYEWDVVCYDSYGVASPPSDRATFTYIIDVSALVGIPIYNEPLTINSTINKKALMEFRGKLYDEVRKYRDIDSSQVLTLFNGEVVPSKDDMNKTKAIMNQILAKDGMATFSTDLLGSDGVLGISDITFIRNKLVEVSYSPPDNPPGGTARKLAGKIMRPVSIVSTNVNALDTTIDIKWGPSEYSSSGWEVTLGASSDTDINYYKFYHEQIVTYNNVPKYFLTETYIKAEQILGGPLFVPDTGRVTSERMWYTAHDMNGRASTVAGTVALSGAAPVTYPNAILRYEVQYQQKPWADLKSDPNAAWYTVYSATGTSFTHTVSAEGSYWYRVRAVDTSGVATPWTYTTDITYVKY